MAPLEAILDRLGGLLVPPPNRLHGSAGTSKTQKSRGTLSRGRPGAPDAGDPVFGGGPHPSIGKDRC
eukprot:9469949-Pyramimonas_sp.AAC.1